jgi:hypothetical protein
MEFLEEVAKWFDMIVDFLNILYSWLGELLNKEPK